MQLKWSVKTSVAKLQTSRMQIIRIAMNIPSDFQAFSNVHAIRDGSAFINVLGWMWTEEKGVQYLAWDGSVYSASSIDGISPQASHQMYRTANSLEKMADQ